MPWTCDACTSINEVDARSVCEVCDTPRPKPKVAAPAPSAAPKLVTPSAGAGAAAAAATTDSNSKQSNDTAKDNKSAAAAAAAAAASGGAAGSGGAAVLDYRTAMATYGARQGLTLVDERDAKDFGQLTQMKTDIIGAAGSGAGRPQHQYTDEAIMAQRDAIQAEIARTQPYVSQAEDFTSLEAEYTSNPEGGNFLKKIAELKKNYSRMRRVRGDGSCFYRAYIFGLLEQLLVSGDKKLLQAVSKRIAESYTKLLNAGFEPIVLDDFFERTYDQFTYCDSKNASVDVIKSNFDDKWTNDCIVSFLRYLTTYHLRKNSREYAPYLPPPYTHDLEQFIKSEVQAVGVESDHIQCMALSAELGIGIRLEYVDHSNRPLNGYNLPTASAIPIVHLLFRPGHFDILYPNTATATTAPAETATATASTASAAATPAVSSAAAPNPMAAAGSAAATAANSNKA